MLVLKRTSAVELNGKPEGPAQSQIEIVVPASAVPTKIVIHLLLTERPGTAKIGIDAPRDVAIRRGELEPERATYRYPVPIRPQA